MVNARFIEKRADGVAIRIIVQPRSAKTAFAGLHGDALKIKLTAPPVDNAANRQCIQFLAKCLKRPKSSISVISGQTSRNKLILCQYDPASPAADQADCIRKALLEQLS